MLVKEKVLGNVQKEKTLGNVYSFFRGNMYVYMYICFFISQPQQHKSKHKNTIKAEKKEAVKNNT